MPNIYISAGYPIDYRNAAFEGDSLTVGVGSTGGNEYPTQTMALFSDVWHYYNFGVNGQTVAQMIADAASQVDPTLVPPAVNICILWGGTNSLYFGGTAAATYADIVTYCNARRAAGWTVIVGTITPRTNAGTPGTFEADRQTVNAAIRANWPSFADALADIAADSRLGDAGDETDTTYYTDLVHMTDAGYAVVASIVHATMLTLL